MNLYVLKTWLLAERSFKQEVEKLKLGAGEEFRGEGILGITKALLESGVSYVAAVIFMRGQVSSKFNEAGSKLSSNGN